MNTLVVDDDRERQILLRSWLQTGDTFVTLAGNLGEALEVLSRLEFDMVVCALTGHQDATSLCAMIRESPRLSNIYILLLTAGSDELLLLDEVDADDLIALPVNEKSLLLRVRAAARVMELRKTSIRQDAMLRSVVQKMGIAYSSIESDLQAASAIQLGLLPTVSEVHPSFRADWLVLPSSFLTGDNLNYFMLQDRYLVFYQADVAGHGIPSALLSITLSQLLSPQPGSPMVRFDPNRDMKRVVPPADVVTELNRRFVAQEGSYFTILYGVLDTRTGEIRFCQAGHPSPLQVAQDRSIKTVGDGGFPVGLWPEMTYDETRAQLEAGERFVLYSDGLLECMNPEGVRYSVERLRRLLARNTETPIKDVLRIIQEELEGWSQGGSLKDDISMLIIERS